MPDKLDLRRTVYNFIISKNESVMHEHNSLQQGHNQNHPRIVDVFNLH